MKTITAYTSEEGSNIYKKKSDALAYDAQLVASKISAKCVSNGSDAHRQLTQSFMKLADAHISPARLARMYKQVWRVKLAFQAALEEEKQQEEKALPF